MSKSYPAFIRKDGDSFLVTFRDIPEATTVWSTLEEAAAMAEDAFATAFEFYDEDGRELPRPSSVRQGERLISANRFNVIHEEVKDE